MSIIEQFDDERHKTKIKLENIEKEWRNLVDKKKLVSKEDKNKLITDIKEIEKEKEEVYNNLMKIEAKIRVAVSDEILKESDILNRMINEIGKKVVGEKETIKTILLSACGSYVNNNQTASYNLLVNSEAGSGKDYVVKNTLDIFPNSSVVSRTRISPTAFTYWKTPYEKDGKEYNKDWTWNGKICYLEDIANAVMNHEVFKVMCSNGSHATVVIKQVAYDKKIEGKPVMIVTSATAEPNPELTRRFTIINLDESIDQTKEIMKLQARQDANNLENEYNENITNALLQLKRVNVRIPYAEKLIAILPSNSIVMRTHFQRFLDYIKSSAALHQYQRATDVDDFIVANGEDYNNARDVLIKLTSNKFMIPLTTTDKNMLELFRNINEPLTIRELEPKVTFCSLKQIYNVLDKLVKYGFLEKDIRRDDYDNRKNATVYKLKQQLGKISIPKWVEIEKSL